MTTPAQCYRTATLAGRYVGLGPRFGPVLPDEEDGRALRVALPRQVMSLSAASPVPWRLVCSTTRRDVEQGGAYDLARAAAETDAAAVGTTRTRLSIAAHAGLPRGGVPWTVEVEPIGSYVLPPSEHYTIGLRAYAGTVDLDVGDLPVDLANNAVAVEYLSLAAHQAPGAYAMQRARLVDRGRVLSEGSPILYRWPPQVSRYRVLSSPLTAAPVALLGRAVEWAGRGDWVYGPGYDVCPCEWQSTAGTVGIELQVAGGTSEDGDGVAVQIETEAWI